jgi:GxxExxY protein
MKRDEIDCLGEQIVGALIEVHRHPGPGLLESAYEIAFCHELTLRGISFTRQIPVPVIYKVSIWMLPFAWMFWWLIP